LHTNDLLEVNYNYINETGFMDSVKQSWEQPVNSLNKERALHIKLARLAKALKNWSKGHLCRLKQEAHDAEQPVLSLDQQDLRQLTETETQQRKTAKSKILGLAAIWKVKLRQCSRLTWIRAGDANTKIFHLRANARRRKNYIPVLQYQQCSCITHEAKAEALHNYYNEKLGSAPQRECTIDWNTLQTPRYDLAELEKEVTEEEIYTALMQTPPEKSP
jgi:hypothetical protein